jgi:hypothetical protein
VVPKLPLAGVRAGTSGTCQCGKPTVPPHCLLTGEIPRVCPFETGFPPHATQWTPDPESWEHDPHIMDERCVAVKVSQGV